MSGFLSWWKNYNTRAFCWMCACGYCGYMCVCAAVLRQDSWREYREKYSGDFLYLFGKSFFGFNPFAQHPAPLLLRRQRLGGGRSSWPGEEGTLRAAFSTSLTIEAVLPNGLLWVWLFLTIFFFPGWLEFGLFPSSAILCCCERFLPAGPYPLLSAGHWVGFVH